MADTFAVYIQGEYVATAILRKDVAPLTCASIEKVLPLASTIMHVTHSGEGVFFPIDVDLDIDIDKGYGSDGVNNRGQVVQGSRLIRPENESCFVSQGDFVITPYKACIVAYGRRCIIRSYGGDLPSNVFAYVRDPDEQDRLEKAAKRTLKYGALAIELKKT